MVGQQVAMHHTVKAHSLCSCSLRPLSVRRSLSSRPLQHRRLAQQVRAAAESETKPAEAGAKTEDVPEAPKGELFKPLTIIDDDESFTDVFAFAGSLPERVNGRLAMMGFAGAVAAELSTGKTVLEQFSSGAIQVTFFMFLISIGSLVPKFASGVPLSKLYDAASRGSMPSVLAFFNKTHEIWLGRVAMIGILGLVATESFLHRALFHF